MSSPEDIGLNWNERKKIRSLLDPPFEDLFDEAEEYVLKLLIVPWNQMLNLDQASYRKVCLQKLCVNECTVCCMFLVCHIVIIISPNYE